MCVCVCVFSLSLSLYGHYLIKDEMHYNILRILTVLDFLSCCFTLLCRTRSGRLPVKTVAINALVNDEVMLTSSIFIYECSGA